jgi:hypothetical protein
MQDSEKMLADPATPSYLLELATKPSSPVEVDDFHGLVSVALAYLAEEKFQEELVQLGAVPTLLKAFSDAYTRFDIDQLDPEEATDLKQLRLGFVQALADVSALNSFTSMYPLNSVVVQTFQTWLRSGGGFTSLETAACLCLGNLSRSDDSSVYLVQEVQLHLPLIALLTKPYPDAPMPGQLLHAILSFLKNLAIPAANKPILGILLDAPANILPRLWSSTDTQPQIQFAAVSLTRLLLVTCPPNVKRVCAPLSPDPSSPASERSNLHVLAALFDRVDAEPTKLEAARAVAAVCRVLHSAPVLPLLPTDWATEDGVASPPPPPGPLPEPSSPGGARRARFYNAHLDIADALTYLVEQKRYPALRSETFFVFALMSHAPDGARVVVRALTPMGACRALVEAVSGRDMVDGTDLRLLASAGGGPDDDGFAAVGSSSNSQVASSSGATVGLGDALDGLGLEPQQADPAQVAGMAKIDRENGLVMIAEILKNYADFLPPFRRTVFEELLRTGGELVLHERLNRDEQMA